MADPGKALWIVARVHAPDEGGVQTYVSEVAHAYAALGWRVTIFAKSSAGPRRIDADRISLVDVGPASLLRVYGRLFRAMAAAWWQSERPAMIHACTWRAALPALLFPRPLVVTVHGREVGRPKGAALLLLRLVLKRARRIVAVSDVTRQLLLSRIPAAATRVITAWNGVRLPADRAVARSSADQGPVRLLTVCRLVPRKNIPAAVTAVAAAIGQGVALSYAIAGRGVDSIRVRERVRASGLDEHIRPLGFVPDEEVARHYREADIFLHPQIALEDGAEVEGFGLSVADAMAHGMACIVGRDGGPAELVVDGVTGLVVDGGSHEAMVAAIGLLARDPALRRQFGERARLWAADHLSWERHCRLCLGLTEPAAVLADQAPLSEAA